MSIRIVNNSMSIIKMIATLLLIMWLSQQTIIMNIDNES